MKIIYERNISMSSTRTDWHEAITCAIQIDLRDYSQILEYETEHFLTPNKNRIDLLIIKKQLDIHIPKHIASIFRTHNIFEIKGLHTTLTTDTYYKTNGHAGYYINSYPGNNSLNRRDITLSFITFRYPRKLFSHLTRNCYKTIANPFPGVYYINTEMYPTQILVIEELSPEDSIYLSCLSQRLNDLNLVNALSEDYTQHKNNKLYTDYMNQFLNSHTKGEQLMVCENLFKLYGTSSEEIAEKTREQDKKIYLPQIEKLTEENNTLISEVNILASEINQLKQLLLKHNIAY